MSLLVYMTDRSELYLLIEFSKQYLYMYVSQLINNGCNISNNKYNLIYIRILHRIWIFMEILFYYSLDHV